MENNAKIIELKEILINLMNRPDATKYMKQQHLLAEAIGILRQTNVDQERLVNIDGVLINYLDAQRYSKIMQEINQNLTNQNNRFI